MKSYVLAITLAMLVAAGFVFQNPGSVTVSFLMWSRELPQGVWEVVLFAAGGILMWGVSLVAMFEERNRYRRQIRNLERRVGELQEERDSLVGALNSLGSAGEAARDEFVQGGPVEASGITESDAEKGEAPTPFVPGEDEEVSREKPFEKSRSEDGADKGRKWIPSWLSRKKKDEDVWDVPAAEDNSSSGQENDPEESGKKDDNKAGDPDLF